MTNINEVPHKYWFLQFFVLRYNFVRSVGFEYRGRETIHVLFTAFHKLDFRVILSQFDEILSIYFDKFMNKMSPFNCYPS